MLLSLKQNPLEIFYLYYSAATLHLLGYYAWAAEPELNIIRTELLQNSRFRFESWFKGKISDNRRAIPTEWKQRPAS